MNAPHGLVTQVGQDSAPPDARTLSLAARLVSVCESDCVVIGCHVCDYECVDDVCACVCVCVCVCCDSDARTLSLAARLVSVCVYYIMYYTCECVYCCWV
jgi:hypothetical protein